MSHAARITTAALALLLAAGSAVAQPGGGFIAPPDALDELSGGSSSGGLNPGTFLDRASGALDAATNRFGQSLLPQNANNQGGDPFGSGGPGGPGGFTPPPFSPPGGFTPPPFSPPGGGPPGAGGFGAAVAGATGRLNASGGERIRSRISGQLLQDARSLKIFATAVQNYYDDGTSGGDAVAGDQVYTNITERNDVMAPDEFVAKSKLLNGLRAIEEMSPQDFTGVRVATQEPTSTLPKLTDLEKERDDRLKAWADQFLRDYRVNPDQMTSPFLPVYMPLPPRAPDIALPAEFSPRWRPQKNSNNERGADGGGTLGRTINDSVNGEPVGAASSRYF
jgi:hypothetical protein